MALALRSVYYIHQVSNKYLPSLHGLKRSQHVTSITLLLRSLLTGT